MPTQGSVGRERLARCGCAAPVPTSLDADSGRPIRLDLLTLSSSAPFAVTLFPNPFPAGNYPSQHSPTTAHPDSGPGISLLGLGLSNVELFLFLGPALSWAWGLLSSTILVFRIRSLTWLPPRCPYGASSSHVLRRPPATANFLPSA